MHVTHEVLAVYAADKVNVPTDEAKARRTQVNNLRTGLESYIKAHPDYDLVKIRAAGSTAKHTAIKRRKSSGSDADVAAYVRAAEVGGVSAPEEGLLSWLRERCIEVYGATKSPDDFKISQHAVSITFHGSGLKIDVAPVLYEDEPDDRGYLVTREGKRVLTSVTLHLEFMKKRRDVAGQNYRELIRLLKAWVREAKDNDEHLRCKSFLIELLVAYIWSNGWNGEALAVDNYPRAFEQVLGYIAHSELREQIVFTDYYKSGEIASSNDAVRVWDPVNPENNIVATYTDSNRRDLVAAANTALGNIAWANVAPNKGDANSAWKEIFGPGFVGA